MSLATLSPMPDDFGDFEFAAIVAGFHTQPIGEPMPDEPERRTSRQRSRGVEVREAIEQSLGIVRHRTGEREA
jgi:hypothetical protein